MDNSTALAADPSRLASLLLGHEPKGMLLVAPRHPGALTAIIERFVHSRALRAAR